ncbi:MAG TPA: DUF190 domain-containing protein [Panacibacter sp.]|nr:DUF190 domain-containing protein [Panacibacter sp.]HNP44378.1 DUF190 domain-containing protein [Panacibacter sp.]
MQNGEALLLRIFVGESDRLEHKPVYEVIVTKARECGLAGATVLRGMLGYGASAVIHSARLIDISENLPVIVEMVDEAAKINSFIPVINDIFERTGKGALMTTEKLTVIYYQPGKQH